MANKPVNETRLDEASVSDLRICNRVDKLAAKITQGVSELVDAGYHPHLVALLLNRHVSALFRDEEVPRTVDRLVLAFDEQTQKKGRKALTHGLKTAGVSSVNARKLIENAQARARRPTKRKPVDLGAQLAGQFVLQRLLALGVVEERDLFECALVQAKRRASVPCVS